MARWRIEEFGDEVISEINVIPLVDISLVLLIIFMVTANYIMTSSISVDLPKASHTQSASTKESLGITISRDGPVYLDSELVTTKELKGKLTSSFKKNPNLNVILNVDKAVHFKDVIGIMDMLSELQITKMNITVVDEK